MANGFQNTELALEVHQKMSPIWLDAFFKSLKLLIGKNRVLVVGKVRENAFKGDATVVAQLLKKQQFNDFFQVDLAEMCGISLMIKKTQSCI